MTNWLKKVNSIKTTDTSNLVKKADYNTKNAETEKKIFDHDHNNKYITTQKFNRLIAGNFAARLKQENLPTIADIDDFVEKTKFDDKLKNLNQNAMSNKTIFPQSLVHYHWIAITKITNWISTGIYYLKKLNYLILTLNEPYLV